MGFDFVTFKASFAAGVAASPVTLSLTFGAFSLSLIFGTVIAVVRVYEVPVAAALLRRCVDTIKAVPGILLLYIIYFLIVDGFNALAGSFNIPASSKDISSNTIALVALTFMGTVTVSETIRGGFLSISRGQYEAASSVGLTGFQTLRRIILPQVLPVALPVLCNNIIIFVKMSSIMYFISVLDILNAAMIPATGNYRFLEAYAAAALLYWIIGFAIERASKLLEKAMGRFRREAAL